MEKGLLVAGVAAALLALPTVSAAKIDLHGRAKYVATYDSYFVDGNTTVPPKEFLMDCLSATQSTVNRDWSLVNFRYGYIEQHPEQCPQQYLANGWSLMHLDQQGYWDTTTEGDEGCPTYTPEFGGPRMPRAVGVDLFGRGPGAC
jgi:hypothetical protein